MYTPQRQGGTAPGDSNPERSRRPAVNTELITARGHGHGRGRQWLRLATLSALFLAGPAMAALECKPFVEVSGVDVLKTLATTLATNAWPAKASMQHGVQFANWSNAKDKSTSCKLTTSPVGVNVWSCTVRAKPCILK